MSPKQAYMIIDIGTGNVRVAIVSTGGKVLHVERDNVVYEKDDRYPDALYFDPVQLWDKILDLAGKALKSVQGIDILAVTASSQREGIVLIDAKGNSLIGLSNHDHRGREWENIVKDKGRVYQLTGRFPSSLFSALKLVGIRERRPRIYEKVHRIMSISDWAQYMISGVEGYEHSQASETLLYDVEAMAWSEELCRVFEIDQSILPVLHHSGSILGNVLPKVASQLNLSSDIPVIVGGADTQLAIRSTQPVAGDIVLVSGTTTPVVKITGTYQLDDRQRTWTGRHIEHGKFVLEANAGVTGLNYQRLKEIFYPNEKYDVMEQEVARFKADPCVASLGGLVADEPGPLTKGGFLFDAPVSHQLSRAHFAQSILWDIACTVKENVEVLTGMAPYDRDYVWGCGGGFRSRTLTQYIAGLLGKRVLIRDYFPHASVTGGALICGEALNIGGGTLSVSEPKEFAPKPRHDYEAHYKDWKKLRSGLRQIYTGDTE